MASKESMQTFLGRISLSVMQESPNKLSFDTSALMAMEQRYRANFINSLSGFKAIQLIGTQDSEGRSNLAIFNSVVHLGANPALLGFILRPDSVERHTWSNIQNNGHYTLNHIDESIYRQAHQCAAKYPKAQSEFEATGLRPLFRPDFPAPFVAESPIQLGLVFRDRLPIAINGTSLIIGEIVQVHCAKDCLAPDGYVNLEKAGSLAGSALDGYHKTRLLERLPYARA